MDVNMLSLRNLFVTPVRYDIPRFQRAYIWNQEKQWDSLWEDLQNTTEEYMESQTPKGTGFQAPRHFLGAIVLQQEQVPTPGLSTRRVVDGQQRLITLQLLLDAIQEVFSLRGINAAAKRLELLVLNDEAFAGSNSDYRFKVWPTINDEDSFRHAMDNHLPTEQHEDSLIVQAHRFFKDQTFQWLDANKEDIEARAHSLEQAITNLFELVVIDLQQTDDPHIIFETLNARGTPLLESDLIKNMVLYEAGKANVGNDALDLGELWAFKDNWWRKNVQQGRLVRPRIEVFLNYWLIMRRRDEVNADKVFASFREYYQSSNKNIRAISTDIGSVSDSYRALEENPPQNMRQFIYRSNVMQAGTLTPVLLWMLSSNVPSPQLKKALRALESHQVRRMICRRTSRGYNLLFIRLLGLLEAKGPERAGDTILHYLAGQKSDVGEWPTDHALQNAFLSNPVYNLLTRGRLRLVLEGIEEQLRTDRAETASAPTNLTIEHVMPQGWRQNWALPKDEQDNTAVEETRDQLIHSIGNLTLVNNRLNQTLSNAPWVEKRKTLNKHSTLFLNKSLLDRTRGKWDEHAIARRARRLHKAAISVWPYADGI